MNIRIIVYLAFVCMLPLHAICSRPIQECDRSKNATIPNIRCQKLSANGPLPTRTRRNGEHSDFVTSRVSSPERHHPSVIAQVSSSGCHHSRVVTWVSVLKFYIMIGAKSVSGMEWIRLPVRKGCGTGRSRPQALRTLNRIRKTSLS